MIFFVYGTLKRKKHNNYLLTGATFLGEHKTEPVYTLYDGPYPIVERGGETAISGELFETTDENVIDGIFRLEGCSKVQHSPNSWYDYDKIATPNGEAVIFVMNEGGSQRSATSILSSGIWRD